MDYTQGLDKARARGKLIQHFFWGSSSGTFEIRALFHIKHTERIFRSNFNILVFPHPDKYLYFSDSMDYYFLTQTLHLRRLGLFIASKTQADWLQNQLQLRWLKNGASLFSVSDLNFHPSE